MYELAKKSEQVEMLMLVADQQMELANLKSAYADLQNENTALKIENENLKNDKGRSGFGSARAVRV